MYGDGSLGEVAIGESPDTPLLIIPEVGLATKTLVFMVELDMLSRSSLTESQSLELSPAIGSAGTFDANVTLNPVVAAFSEVSNEIADGFETSSIAHDAAVTVPSATQRVMLDIGYTSLNLVSDVLDPSGAAIGLSKIASGAQGGGTNSAIFLLTESQMPAAAGYTLRMRLDDALQLFRQIVVLQGANQTVSAGDASAANTNTITVNVTRALGDFPVGSKVYAIGGDGQGNRTYSVSGDASFVRQNVTDWDFVEGACFAQGEIGTAKATASVTFNLSGNANRLSACIAVVEPAS